MAAGQNGRETAQNMVRQKLQRALKVAHLDRISQQDAEDILKTLREHLHRLSSKSKGSRALAVSARDFGPFLLKMIDQLCKELAIRSNSHVTVVLLRASRIVLDGLFCIKSRLKCAPLSLEKIGYKVVSLAYKRKQVGFCVRFLLNWEVPVCL